MKKYLIVILSLLLFLVACGNNSSNDEENAGVKADNASNVEEEAEENENEEQSMEVNKGLLNVEITLPATFFEDENIDAVIAEAEADGVKEVKQNDDGTLTYKMSKSVHREMMKEMEEELEQSIAEMVNDEDYPSIEDITHDNSYSEFTMVVNQEAFENSLDGFAAFGLGISGMFYQLFDGVDPEKYEVIINVQDADTGDIIDTIVYPDALDEMEL